MTRGKKATAGKATAKKAAAKQAAAKRAGGAGMRAAAADRDIDLDLVGAAFSPVTEIDRRYRKATIADQIKLKPKRDEAFAAYSLARLKLLEAGMISTDQDLADMRALKTEVDRAAVTQDLIIAAARVAIFLAKLAAK